MTKISKISGFPEWLPEQKIAEDKVIHTLVSIFESYGFTHIETPAIELLSTLSSKGVIDKELYAVKRYHADETQEAEMGLHFDLTVPLARYVAQHEHALSFPFKRYQIQKVWRGDRPQKGRFREFYQADIDIISRNDLPIACDAEILSVAGLIMEKLNFGPYTLRINHRGLLQGLYAQLGLNEEQCKHAIIAVDKILKIGPSGVRAELQKISGVTEAAIERIIETTSVQCTFAELPSRIAALNLESSEVAKAVEDLLTIGALLPTTVREHVVVDVSLARGLNYYTGLILETVMTNFPEFGSVFSGGRYENLASDFSTSKLPGVGVSLGLSRLMELVFDNSLIDTSQRTITKALVCVYNESDRPYCNEVATELRSAGLPTEVYFKSPKLGKQIEYADAKRIPFVLFVDAANRKVEVKNLATKEQTPIGSLREWATSVGA